MNEPYKSNTEPKVGDKVKFNSSPEEGVFEVTSVGGGRLGNKVCVRPVGVNTFGREYYYYCLCPVKA